MLRTLIIDDEKPVRDTLSGLLKKICPQVMLVGEADGVKTGLHAIRENSPDLVLLDIKMDDGTGLDLLHQIENINFKIIFITAYEEFAIKAFEFSAIDYILKPVNPEKLEKAVKQAERLKQHVFITQISALKANLEDPGNQNKKIIIKNRESIFLLNVDDILHCESDGSYTIVETKDNQKIIVSKVLKEYDKLLSESGFIRIHRSHLINLKHIKRFDKQDGGILLMSNNTWVPVSTTGRVRLLELFDELEG